MSVNLHGPGLWYATRATGLVSLVLLTASVLLGLLTAGRFSSQRWPRFLTQGMHRNVSLLVLVFLALHIGGTVLDSYTSISLTADRAAARIAATVGCGALVNLGGDISVAGQPPEGGWPVGVADDATFDTTTATVEARQVIVIMDGGLATSSVLGRAWQRGDEQLHHIIDPRTGMPAQSCWRAVSVAAGSCVDANIASTAAILRGERAIAWLARLRLPARLTGTDGSVVTVAGWPVPGAGA